MWERTLTIGSAGKSFSVTGWKVGRIYCWCSRPHPTPTHAPALRYEKTKTAGRLDHWDARPAGRHDTRALADRLLRRDPSPGPLSFIGLYGAFCPYRRVGAFVGGSRAQDAIAVGFEQEAQHNFFHEQRQSLLRKRTVVLDVLEELGVPHDRPQGAYFVLFDTTRLAIPADQQHPNESRDWDVSRFFTSTIGCVRVKSAGSRAGGLG